MICAMCKEESNTSMFSYLNENNFKDIDGMFYCPKCVDTMIKWELNDIIVTTTNSLEGYDVVEYINIESVEYVIGTGVFSEFDSNFNDFFGLRSTSFEKKLQEAKEAVIDKLKYLAYKNNGNAVIGIDLDYTEFSGNRIGIVANGTTVKIVKKHD